MSNVSDYMEACEEWKQTKRSYAFTDDAELLERRDSLLAEAELKIKQAIKQIIEEK